MPQISLRKIAYKTSTFIVLTLLIVSGLSFNLSLSHADNLSINGPTNCDNNAVIYCGAASVNSLINKYNNGDSLNSAASIHHIYSYFGISSNDINGMNGNVTNETVEVGTVNKDGGIYDGNGKLIANQAVTAGRVEGQNASGNQPESVDGTNFFVRAPSVSFINNSLSAYVVMINNRFAFAILSSCGNPVIATPIIPPTPKPKPTPTPTPMPKPTVPKPTKTTLNYCSGNTDSSNSGIASQGGNCSQNTTVVQTPPPTPPSPTPFGQCASLSLNIVNNSPLEVNVTANPTTGNGAQLQNVVFNFGDGTITSPSSQTTASHTYASTGNYTITATLSFTDNGQSVSNATCQAVLTSTSPPPTVTTASTPPTPSTSSQSTTPTPSTSLVNTGPGNVVALFGISSTIGLLGYRAFIARRLRVH